MFWERAPQLAMIFFGIGALSYLASGIRDLPHDRFLKKQRIKLVREIPVMYPVAYILLKEGKKKQNPTKQDIVEIFIKLDIEFDPQ
jgi:hypothetical protein